VTAPESGMTHSMAIRVYYEDTDGSGIVYYANYLKFAERGRTEMMRALGFAHSRIHAETGIVFTVRRLSADYREPARLDDALTVVACVGLDGRPRRVPAGLRAALTSSGPTTAMPDIIPTIV